MRLLTRCSIMAVTGAAMMAMTAPVPLIADVIDTNTTIESAMMTTNLTVGSVSPDIVLTIASGGSVMNTNGLNVGSGNGSNETVIITGSGSLTTDGRRFQNITFNNTSGNRIIVTNGGTFAVSGDGGTLYWGSQGSLAAISNVVVVTGPGSLFTNGTPSSGVNLWLGNYSGLIVSNGGAFVSLARGLYLSGRDIWGGGPLPGGASGGRFAVVTGPGSVLRTAVMSVNNGNDVRDNRLEISDGGAVYSRAGYITSDATGQGGNGGDCSATVTGPGSLWDVGAGGSPGALDVGCSDTASNNVLDICNGAVVTNVGTLQVGKAGAKKSAVNLGDGKALAVLSVQSVSLADAEAHLSFDNGLLQAAKDGALVSGSGAISNKGPAYVATGFTSSIDSAITGSGSLTKRGSGTLTLRGTNSYTGDTVVESGALALGVASLCDSGDVRVAAGAGLVLQFSGFDVIGGLYHGGVPQPRGFYCAGALDGAISGSGCLKVTRGPEASGAYIMVR